MNFLEKYASNCGVKISKPSIPYAYFPMQAEKYIVIDNRNRNISNIYDLYDDVISYIYEYLINEEIYIVNLCSSEKHIIAKTFPYLFLSKKQEAYILKNSLLNICSDNYSSHISDCFDVPSIGLYSSIPSNATKPIIGNKHSVLESKRNGNLPSYFDSEMPKNINYISPEEIAQKILDKLGIKTKIKNETVYTGSLYAIKLVEVIPDFIPDSTFLLKNAINIRMDYNFDEEILQYWLSNRYTNILTKKPVNLSLLKHFKENIIQFTIEINESFTEEYIKEAKECGIPVKIFCSEKEKLSHYRMKFFDFEVEESIFKSRKDLEAKDLTGLKFLSSRMLISKGKKYSSKKNLDLGIELCNSYEDVIDDPSFWEDLDYYRIIKIYE